MKIRIIKFIVLLNVMLCFFSSFKAVAYENKDGIYALSILFSKKNISTNELNGFLSLSESYYSPRDEGVVSRKYIIRKSQGDIVYLFKNKKIYNLMNEFLDSAFTEYGKDKLKNKYSNSGIYYYFSLKEYEDGFKVIINEVSRPVDGFCCPEYTYIYYFKVINDRVFLYDINVAG